MGDNAKTIKFELFPLDKLVINDTDIYLGKSKEQFIKLLGEPEAAHKHWDGNGASYYYFNSELMFDCDNNSNISFIEFNGGYEGELKPIIYGVSAFELKTDELYNTLEKHNNGRIDAESEESYGFVETSVGIWKDGANDETDHWTTVGIGEKDYYLEIYESRKQDNDK